jgi:hypothetical protein
VDLKDRGKYIGMWNLTSGKMEGFGFLLWSDGSLQEGLWKNGLMNFRGRIIHADGDVYEGEWKDDTNHGTGEYHHHGEGTKFEGNWFEDT